MEKSKYWMIPVLLVVISGFFGFHFLSKNPIPTVLEPSAVEKSMPSEARIPEKITEDNSAPVVPELVLAYCQDPYQSTCDQRWPSVDPSGQVRPDVSGEVRALRLMRKMVQKNPDWTADQVQENLAIMIYTDQRRERAFKVFEWAKSQILQWIAEKSDVFNKIERQALIERIQSVTLNMPPPASEYAEAVDLITKNAVYYERTSTGELRLRVGGAYLMSTTSWYNMVFTFAHEIAHSIDPCEMKNFGLVPRSYQPLIQCFVERDWVEEDRRNCGSLEQVSEVFADWVASEIFSRALSQWSVDYSPEEKIKAAINSTRDLCEQSIEGQSLNLSYHQDPQTRIGQILGLRPQIQTILGCPDLQAKSFQYCSLTLPEPL